MADIVKGTSDSLTPAAGKKPTDGTRNHAWVTDIYIEDDWEEEGDLSDFLEVLAWHDNTGVYKRMLGDSRREAETYWHAQV